MQHASEAIVKRHNIHVYGNSETSLGDTSLGDIVFAHGFGCDQNMWRLLAPAFADRYRLILYDLVGSGQSDLSAYDRERYGTLRGHARDLVEIVDTVCKKPVVFVGHSVSSMIGLLADIEAPGRFRAHVMVGPSPCYINEGDYVGGFEREDIDSLLDTLDSNYLGWASAMAPRIMGAPERPALGEELANSFCRTDPEIARHFARVTFTSDNRGDLEKLHTPTLLVQCSDDLIAPLSVGDYLHGKLPNSKLHVIENLGHCPHLSSPTAIAEAMTAFLE